MTVATSIICGVTSFLRSSLGSNPLLTDNSLLTPVQGQFEAFNFGFTKKEVLKLLEDRLKVPKN